MCTVPLARRFCRECYSQPQELYDRLKQRGMDLVTITDHDSIDAVECLRRHPDFFLSEELTCTLPSGSELHVGVYDITERQHTQLQRLRRDFPALLAYLNEQRLFFSANHIFSALTGRRHTADFELFRQAFPALETLNSTLPERSNRSAALFAAWHRRAAIGGSDAHTLATAGDAWTRVPGAATAGEFLAGLRSGAGRPEGASGSWSKLTRDVLQIGCNMMKEHPYGPLLGLLSLPVPLITFANYLVELQFSQYWMRRLPADCPTSAPLALEASL
jgi:predicted metal-dependent phosphoesterase TrpH